MENSSIEHTLEDASANEFDQKMPDERQVCGRFSYVGVLAARYQTYEGLPRDINLLVRGGATVRLRNRFLCTGGEATKLQGCLGAFRGAPRGSWGLHWGFNPSSYPNNPSSLVIPVHQAIPVLMKIKSMSKTSLT